MLSRMGCQRVAEQLARPPAPREAQEAPTQVPSHTQICARVLLAWDLVLFFCSSLTEKRNAHKERKRQGKKNSLSTKQSLRNLGVLSLRQIFRNFSIILKSSQQETDVFRPSKSVTPQLYGVSTGKYL